MLDTILIDNHRPLMYPQPCCFQEVNTIEHFQLNCKSNTVFKFMLYKDARVKTEGVELTQTKVNVIRLFRVSIWLTLSIRHVSNTPSFIAAILSITPNTSKLLQGVEEATIRLRFKASESDDTFHGFYLWTNWSFLVNRQR